MLTKLLEIQQNIQAALEKAQNLNELETLRVHVLGKKGELTTLLRGLGQLSKEERPAFGLRLNEVRVQIEEMMARKEAKFQEAEKEKRLGNETIDVTLPVTPARVGGVHPLSRTLEEIVGIFVGMGFEVVEGPEVELDLYNFELLNLPKNHPARDMQDTFYISDSIVMRTHTSPMQARTMQKRQPPIRIICPGRVYRAEENDATHGAVFHQVEGLVVGKGITMADLKGTLDAFAKALYGQEVQTRFRPSFFPFTEPSAEVDVSCSTCKGVGCRVCKGTGWIEVLGSGMVNPKVLSLCGIDPDVYTGFAFGVGLDRVTNIKYAISDMRILFDNDVRFISQFR